MSSAQSARTEYSGWLLRHGLFSSIPEAIVGEFGRKIVVTEHNAGSVLYRQNEKATGAFVVFKGRVKITAIVGDGRTALLKIAGPGEMLGLSTLVAARRHVATAQVLASAVIGFAGQDEIWVAMRKHPQMAEAIAHTLAAECIDTICQTLFLRVPCSSSQRLAAALLRVAESSNMNGSWDQSPIPYTHAELAQLIGASRETVTRLLKSFQQKGLMMSNGSGNADRELLRDLAGEGEEL